MQAEALGLSVAELEEELEDEEDMTDAFLLSSARVGVAGCVVSGDGVVTWSLSIRGSRRAGEQGDGGGRNVEGGKKLREEDGRQGAAIT